MPRPNPAADVALADSLRAVTPGRARVAPIVGDPNPETVA